ncbi:hypothetical protein CLCR_01747 [Cladophialophora carrionii]|uniref:Uncharacterized protein n=1 Tax=Cladophialophora carrionii TaxID=86049 RepID=A0A1C1CAH1_9EURO|nr:hypothetical protein CLCR_01747 [Cladophialophora carrionii]
MAFANLAQKAAQWMVNSPAVISVKLSLPALPLLQSSSLTVPIDPAVGNTAQGVKPAPKAAAMQEILEDVAVSGPFAIAQIAGAGDNSLGVTSRIAHIGVVAIAAEGATAAWIKSNGVT